MFSAATTRLRRRIAARVLVWPLVFAAVVCAWPLADSAQAEVITINVTVSPSTLVANGSDPATITATVRDKQGRPVNDDATQFSSSDPGQTVSTPTKRAVGTYTAAISSSTTAGKATITASDGVSLTARTTLTQASGPTKVSMLVSQSTAVTNESVAVWAAVTATGVSRPGRSRSQAEAPPSRIVLGSQSRRRTPSQAAKRHSRPPRHRSRSSPPSDPAPAHNVYRCHLTSTYPSRFGRAVGLRRVLRPRNADLILRCGRRSERTFHLHGDLQDGRVPLDHGAVWRRCQFHRLRVTRAGREHERTTRTRNHQRDHAVDLPLHAEVHDDPPIRHQRSRQPVDHRRLPRKRVPIREADDHRRKDQEVRPWIDAPMPDAASSISSATSSTVACAPAPESPC